MSILIDLVLLLIFIGSVVFWYKRGFLRGLLSIVKLVASLVGTYYLQKIFSPFIEKYLPSNISLPQELGGTFLDKIFQGLITNFMSSFIIFVALFIILTLVANFILGVAEDFFFTNLINKIGGFVMGMVIGGVLVIIASYIIGFVVLMKSTTSGIVIINDTHILKYIIQNNIQFLIEVIGK